MVRRLFVALAVLAFVAAACTGSASNSKKGTAGHVVLQLWSFPGSEDVLPPVVQAFNKQYGPGITVEVTNIPENNYGTKLDTSIAAHNTPDLAFPYNASDIPTGSFSPIEAVFKKAGIDLSTFNQGPISNECKYQGHVYCIGNYLGADVLFYNKALFTQAGVPFPAANTPLSVDQYVADACQIYRATGTWGTASGDPFTWLARDNYVTENGQYAHLDTSSLIDVYTKLAGMYKSKCAPSLDVFDPWNQGAQFFSQKKMAMVVTDFRSITGIETAGIDYGVAPVPVPTGAHPEVYTWTDNIGVVKYSKNPAEAMKFLEFLATTGQKIAVSAAGDFPLSPQVAVETHWAKDPGRQEFLQVQKLVQPEVYIPDIWNISGPVFDAFSAVLNGTSPREALSAAQGQYQTQLDQACKSYLKITGGLNPNQGITYDTSSSG